MCACNCGSRNNKWAEMVAKRNLEAQLKKKLEDKKKEKDKNEKHLENA